MEHDDEPSGAGAKGSARPATAAERPFDVWLRKQLHAMYDEVAKEPLPADLLKLIDDDAGKASAPEAGAPSSGKPSPKD